MIKITKEQKTALEELCKGIQMFIKENFHPYVSVIVEDTSVRVEETFVAEDSNGVCGSSPSQKCSL